MGVMSDNVKFTKIGYGYVHTTKKGTKCLNLKLDSTAFISMATVDINKSIYLFKNKNDSYSVFGATNMDYKFTEKKHEEDQSDLI